MVVFLLVPVLLFMLFKRLFGRKPKRELANKHVVIVGGSSGIGKSMAILAARKKAHVTIIARRVDKLQDAVKEIEDNAVDLHSQKIDYVSIDVTNYEDIEKNLDEIEQLRGPIFMLANCAGFAICGELENFSVNQINTLINVNLLGSIYPIKALVPKFKERKEGIFILCGSQVSLFGLYGYSIYSSCKFALRGLAESIHMELKPFNVSVTLALPPDTDTPGFEIENKSKPKETQLISKMGSLFDPNEVAEKILTDALDGNFFSHIGFESFIMTTLCKGMSPFNSIAQLIFESTIVGLLRLISAYYLTSFHNIVKKCHKEKSKDDKQKKSQ